jgi:hypothetical protein
LFDREDSPIVTLGWDTPSMIELASPEIEFAAHEATALSNLRARRTRAEWQLETLEGPEGSMDVYVRTGDSLTASELWDPEFVSESAKMVGSDVVLFITPTREAMAMSTHVRALAALAFHKVSDPDGEFVLGSHAFAFSGGELSLVGQMAQGGGPSEA